MQKTTFPQMLSYQLLWALAEVTLLLLEQSEPARLLGRFFRLHYQVWVQTLSQAENNLWKWFIFYYTTTKPIFSWIPFLLKRMSYFLSSHPIVWRKPQRSGISFPLVVTCCFSFHSSFCVFSFARVWHVLNTVCEGLCNQWRGSSCHCLTSCLSVVIIPKLHWKHRLEEK